VHTVFLFSPIDHITVHCALPFQSYSGSCLNDSGLRRKGGVRKLNAGRSRVVRVKNLAARFQSCPQQPRALLITTRGIASPIEASFLLPCLLRIMLEPARLLALGFLLSLLSTTEGQATQEVLSQNTKLSNESLLWGPYRPNLYFGVRPRIPKSLMTGLLWAKVDSFQGVQNSTF